MWKKNSGKPQITQTRKMNTLSTPLFKLIRVKEGEVILSPKEQKMYRCGVGVLLYLIKQMRPDLADATSELSKAMNVANYLHWRELLCVIVYALKTQEKGIVLKPNFKLVKLNLKMIQISLAVNYGIKKLISFYKRNVTSNLLRFIIFKNRNI